jgi:hypothetical protein
MLPDNPDPALEKFVTQWRPAAIDSPRQTVEA